jgi:hypothetical protein
LELHNPPQDFFRKRLEERLPFGDYLARNVEAAILDSIELKDVTWAAMIFAALLSALLHQFFPLNFLGLSLLWVVIAIFVLAVMHISTQTQLCKISRTAEALIRESNEETDADAPASEETEAQPKKAGFHERYNTELIMMRLLQMSCLVLSFGVAHTIFAVHQWQHKGTYLGLNLMLYLLPALIMPYAVADFLVIMALPPCVDDGNIEALIAAIRSRGSGEGENLVSTKDLLIDINRRLAGESGHAPAASAAAAMEEGVVAPASVAAASPAAAEELPTLLRGSSNQEVQKVPSRLKEQKEHTDLDMVVAVSLSL